MHWKEYVDRDNVPIFTDHNDIYGFYGIFELGIDLAEQNNLDETDIDLENVPEQFWECDQELLGTCRSDLALRLFEGYSPCNIAEGLIEDLYSLSELDYPDYCDLIGYKQFESDLLHFKSINQLWWTIVGRFKWFNPCKHSIGLNQLNPALERLSAQNKSIGLWEPDFRRPIDLDSEFWRSVFREFTDD